MTEGDPGAQPERQEARCMTRRLGEQQKIQMHNQGPAERVRCMTTRTDREQHETHSPAQMTKGDLKEQG